MTQRKRRLDVCKARYGKRHMLEARLWEQPQRRRLHFHRLVPDRVFGQAREEVVAALQKRVSQARIEFAAPALADDIRRTGASTRPRVELGHARAMGEPRAERNAVPR